MIRTKNCNLQFQVFGIIYLYFSPLASAGQNLTTLASLSSEHHQEIIRHSTWPRVTINNTYFEKFCPASTECEFTLLSCRFLRQLTNLTQGNIVLLQT